MAKTVIQCLLLSYLLTMTIRTTDANQDDAIPIYASVQRYKYHHVIRSAEEVEPAETEDMLAEADEINDITVSSTLMTVSTVEMSSFSMSSSIGTDFSNSTITSPTTTTTMSETTSKNKDPESAKSVAEDSGSDVGPGAIAAIVAGILIIGALGVVAFLVIRSKRANKVDQDTQPVTEA